jgi:hypothetical protein
MLATEEIPMAVADEAWPKPGLGECRFAGDHLPTIEQGVPGTRAPERAGVRGGLEADIVDLDGDGGHQQERPTPVSR